MYCTAEISAGTRCHHPEGTDYVAATICVSADDFTHPVPKRRSRTWTRPQYWQEEISELGNHSTVQQLCRSPSQPLRSHCPDEVLSGNRDNISGTRRKAMRLQEWQVVECLKRVRHHTVRSPCVFSDEYVWEWAFASVATGITPSSCSGEPARHLLSLTNDT